LGDGGRSCERGWMRTRARARLRRLNCQCRFPVPQISDHNSFERASSTGAAKFEIMGEGCRERGWIHRHRRGCGCPSGSEHSGPPDLHPRKGTSSVPTSRYSDAPKELGENWCGISCRAGPVKSDTAMQRGTMCVAGEVGLRTVVSLRVRGGALEDGSEGAAGARFRTRQN